MADFSSTITEDLKQAMRAKDTVSLTVLRSLKSALKNAAIEKGGADAVLDESESLAVVRKQLKQRTDSIDAFRDAGRTDLQEKEEAEAAILERYLPAALGDEELEAIVAGVIEETGASSRKDMGKVMGALQAKVAGRADNKKLSQAVMAKLS